MPDPAKAENRFVARALLYNELTDAQARRLAAATDQAPANTQDLSGKPDMLAKAWNYSPHPDPAATFWALHDQTLEQNMAKVGPDSPPEMVTAAHNDAETKALNAVYPHRAELIGVGSRVLEDQVAQAERIKRIVDGHLASQQPEQPAPVEALLPPPAQPPMPAPVPGGPMMS